MKIKVNNYTFSASAKTITFPEYTSLLLDDMLLITNVTTGTIIYNFADPALTGTIVNNVLTLAYNTTSMSNSDKLSIYIDNEETPASDEMLQAIYDMARNLGVLAAARGVAADLRVVPSATAGLPVAQATAANLNATVIQGNPANLLATVSIAASQTLATLTNQTQIGGYTATQQIPALQNQAAIQSNINNITVTVS
jgi:hypothetical protein